MDSVKKKIQKDKEINKLKFKYDTTKSLWVLWYEVVKIFCIYGKWCRWWLGSIYLKKIF